MISVNLLPYRTEEKRRRVAHILYLSSLLFVMFVTAVFFTYTFYSGELNDYTAKYKSLKKENKSMSKLIGEVANIDKLRKSVTSKLDLIELLQKGRYYSFSKLLFITKSKPDKVWINKIKDDGDTLFVDGYAMSSSDVSEFMRRLESKSIFNTVSLKLITKKELGDFKGVVISYKITIQQKYKDSDLAASIDNGGKKRKARKVNHKAANK